MASFSVTVNDSHLPRIQAAVNGIWPSWQTEYPEDTMAQFMERKIKTEFIAKVVKRYEAGLLQEQYNEQKIAIQDID